LIGWHFIPVGPQFSLAEAKEKKKTASIVLMMSGLYRPGGFFVAGPVLGGGPARMMETHLACRCSASCFAPEGGAGAFWPGVSTARQGRSFHGPGFSMEGHPPLPWGRLGPNFPGGPFVNPKRGPAKKTGKLLYRPRDFGWLQAQISLFPEVPGPSGVRAQAGRPARYRRTNPTPTPPGPRFRGLFGGNPVRSKSERPPGSSGRAAGHGRSENQCRRQSNPKIGTGIPPTQNKWQTEQKQMGTQGTYPGLGRGVNPISRNPMPIKARIGTCFLDGHFRPAGWFGGQKKNLRAHDILPGILRGADSPKKKLRRGRVSAKGALAPARGGPI